MSKIIYKIPNNFQLPRRIERLGEMANNLWWTWHPDAEKLFTLIDPVLWESIYHNPISFLKKVERQKLNLVVNSKDYLGRYDQQLEMFDRDIKREPKKIIDHGLSEDDLIAYFSFEFGMHESLPVYAGGLGILSGDHLKEASDSHIPLVAVGFIYNEGYFSQRITEDGWQEIRDYKLNLAEMPVIPLYTEDEQFLTIKLELPDRDIEARVWLVQVGNVPLFLLDTNVETNTPEDRKLSARLYRSDPEIRLIQEMLIGIGGVRLLRKLNICPAVWHMNEGHSAFLILERMREFVVDGMTCEEAGEVVKQSNVFTTHTPVPAGNDQFPVWLIEKYYSVYWQQLCKDKQSFIDLAKQKSTYGDLFSMPVLALRFSNQRNAVSELHGMTARSMWKELWHQDNADNVPIQHVTNGVHMGTWVARRMSHLFDQYLGQDWYQFMSDPGRWANIDDIPDAELWAVHMHLKRKLIYFMNERARKQWASGFIHSNQVIASGVLLEPYSLTIGFARRFATYKRANLIFNDIERLLASIKDPHRPVQIIFAGKAHPADEPGKLLIQQVYRMVKDYNVAGRLAFLEDYDINVARYLVQGVDVWLNTPLLPNEASGTSGMKAAMNGVLNFSILDGWWHEAYNGRNGWAIAPENRVDKSEMQDFSDAHSLYSILENEIVPLYYSERTKDNIPLGWISRMKESIRTLAPQFNTRRMLKEYMDLMYKPAMKKES